MTKDEAIKYLIPPIATSTEPSEEYSKQKEAYNMAIESLKTDIDLQDAYEQGYACGWKERFGEPKGLKGEWIGKPIAGYCTVRCSVCQSAFKENSGRWNFCPNCGADMRGEKE